MAYVKLNCRLEWCVLVIGDEKISLSPDIEFELPPSTEFVVKGKIEEACEAKLPSPGFDAARITFKIPKDCKTRAPRIIYYTPWTKLGGDGSFVIKGVTPSLETWSLYRCCGSKRVHLFSWWSTERHPDTFELISIFYNVRLCPSKLTITTTPSRASVYINGEYKGVT